MRLSQWDSSPGRPSTGQVRLEECWDRRNPHSVYLGHQNAPRACPVFTLTQLIRAPP